MARRRNEPLDFAFHELTDVSGMNGGDDAGSAKKTGGEDESKTAAPKRKLVSTNAVRINNNAFESLNGLYEVLGGHVKDPSGVQWIDASFNKLETIDGDEVAKFPKISRLYLHANNIKSLAEVEKLQSIDTLRSLTMHGNPVAEKGLYRNFVISTLPWLRTLDFSPVTDRERDRAITWRQMTAIKRKRRKPKEEA